MSEVKSEFKAHVLSIVASIPLGKVMYYGQIAQLLGKTARSIGFILTGLTEKETASYPWYRVVAKDGWISALKLGERGVLQRKLLEEEGYLIVEDRVDLNQHLWLLAGISQDEDRVAGYASFIEGLKR